jgi:hypothetical protein
MMVAVVNSFNLVLWIHSLIHIVMLIMLIIKLIITNKKKHHNCDENPPSLMASLNRRAVTRDMCTCKAHARSASALQEFSLFKVKYFTNISP